MTVRSYVIIVILGITGFCGASLKLISISKEAAVIDKAIFVVDTSKQSTPHDTLFIKNNKLRLKKKSLTGNSVDKREELLDSSWISYRELTYNLYPNYLSWIMIVSIGIGIAFACWPLTIGGVQRISGKESLLHWIIYILCALLSTAIIFAIAQLSAKGRLFPITKLIQYTDIMFDSPFVVLGWVTALIMSPNIFCLTGNFMVLRQAIKEEHVSGILRLHRHFNQFLTVASILLVFGVLAPTYLRLSILDFLPAKMDYLFPKQFVMAYSLVFTFFLVIFFLPVELIFRHRFAQLKEISNTEERNQIDQLLSGSNVFKMSVSFLAPVLANIFLDSVTSLF